MELHDVWYVPNLTDSLLSCLEMCNDGFDLRFSGKNWTAEKNGEERLRGEWRYGLYPLQAHPLQSHTHGIIESPVTDRSFWALRFGHANYEAMKKLLESNVVHRIWKRVTSGIISWESYVTGKKQRRRLHLNPFQAQKTGTVIHSDVYGKMRVPSQVRFLYFMTFIDEEPRYVTLQPIWYKSDVKYAFIWYHVWFKRRYETSLKYLKSEGGGEYTAL